jgi:hypothetical protein
MNDLVHHIEEASVWLNSLRVPIIGLIALYYALTIAWKVLFHSDPGELWRDFVKFGVAVTGMLALPELVKALTGYFQ